MKKKYQLWGEFLKKRLEQRFRSAREFCCRVSVGISYPQYSRYEAGDQLPNLEQAVQLCKLLEIPVIDGLLEWCRAQMTDPSARQEVDQLVERLAKQQTTGVPVEVKAPPPASSISSLSLDEVIVFNRSHLKLFTSDPAYRDIFTYINSFAPEWIAAEEISRAVGIPLPKLEGMLDQLNDLGVILLAGHKCRSTKRNFYFPDDADFFQLRNDNLVHNFNSILKRIDHGAIAQKRAFRGLVTRELTHEQMQLVFSRCEELMTGVVELPETTNPDRIYSVCMLMGERFARPSANRPATTARRDSKAEHGLERAENAII